MPKRVNNIFISKLKFKNMLEAYERAAKGKKENKEVILFEMNLASNLISILKEIYSKKYKIGKYRKFIIYEPKERIIWSLPFKDRVIHQWYVEEFIKSIFLPKFIKDTYACIDERGVHKAVNTLKYYMKSMYKQNKDYYILKCDISKFFYSIDKEILFNIIQRSVKDKEFLYFTKIILCQRSSSKIGIPIGNYTSQYFANIYLNELDHFIKEKLKVKYYIRYMDDFVLILNSKQEAKEILDKINIFLKERLKLKLNKKTNYFPSKQGVNFCGYKLRKQSIYLLKKSKKKIYRNIKLWNEQYYNKKIDFKKCNSRLQAWIGHAKHTTAHGIINDVKNRCEWIYKGEEG